MIETATMDVLVSHTRNGPHKKMHSRVESAKCILFSLLPQVLCELINRVGTAHTNTPPPPPTHTHAQPRIKLAFYKMVCGDQYQPHVGPSSSWRPRSITGFQKYPAKCRIFPTKMDILASGKFSCISCYTVQCTYNSVHQ